MTRQLNYVLLPENHTWIAMDVDDEQVVSGSPWGNNAEERLNALLDVDVEMEYVPFEPQPLPPGSPMDEDRRIWGFADFPRPTWWVDWPPTEEDSVSPSVPPARVVGGMRVPQGRRNTQKPKSPERPDFLPKPSAQACSVFKKTNSIATSSEDKVEEHQPPATTAKSTSNDLRNNVAGTSSTSTKICSTQPSPMPSTPIRKTRVLNLLSPVRQEPIDDDFFLSSKRHTPNLADGNRWLKISRTPGHNIDNASFIPETDSPDSSYLATAFPPANDEDILFPEILSPVRQSKLDEDFFITSDRQTPTAALGNRWLRTSRTPGRNIDNKSVMVDYCDADYSYLAIVHPLTEEPDDLPLEIDFADVETSSTLSDEAPDDEPEVEFVTPEKRRRIRRARPFSPLSPVGQSRIDRDFFFTSNRETPDLAVGNRWLKTSRTPGRNIDNQSVMFEDAYVDYSYLAVAYPSAEDADTSVDGSTSLFPSVSSGYIADESFSSDHDVSIASLVDSDSFGYLADVSCSIISSISDVSVSVYDHSSGPSRDIHASTEISDIRESANMDDLVASIRNLSIDARDVVSYEEQVNEATQSSIEISGDGAETSVDEEWNSFYPSSLSSDSRESCCCSRSSSDFNPSEFAPVNSSISLCNTALFLPSGDVSHTEVYEDADFLDYEESVLAAILPYYEESECDEGDVVAELPDSEEEGYQLFDRCPTDYPSDVEDVPDRRESVSDPPWTAEDNPFDVFQNHGNETELDVDELDDDLKYLYTLSY